MNIIFLLQILSIDIGKEKYGCNDCPQKYEKIHIFLFLDNLHNRLVSFIFGDNCTYCVAFE